MTTEVLFLNARGFLCSVAQRFCQVSTHDKMHVASLRHTRSLNRLSAGQAEPGTFCSKRDAPRFMQLAPHQSLLIKLVPSPSRRVEYMMVQQGATWRGLMSAGKQASSALMAPEPSPASAHVDSGWAESGRGDLDVEQKTGQAFPSVGSLERSGSHPDGTVSQLFRNGRSTEEPAGVCNEQGLSCAVNVSVRVNMPPPFTAVPIPLLSAAGDPSPPLLLSGVHPSMRSQTSLHVDFRSHISTAKRVQAYCLPAYMFLNASC